MPENMSDKKRINIAFGMFYICFTLLVAHFKIYEDHYVASGLVIVFLIGLHRLLLYCAGIQVEIFTEDEENKKG